MMTVDSLIEKATYITLNTHTLIQNIQAYLAITDKKPTETVFPTEVLNHQLKKST